MARTGDGKCGFWVFQKWASEKLEKQHQGESRGPHRYMAIESHIRAGLPRGEVSERCEDQGKSKGPRRYRPCCILQVCA